MNDGQHEKEKRGLKYCVQYPNPRLSGLLDSNQRPRRPERRALPTALNPDFKSDAKVMQFLIITKFFALFLGKSEKKRTFAPAIEKSVQLILLVP